jgi:hypothetical protein
VEGQKSAQACNPEIPDNMTCQDSVPGLCCPIPVNNANSPEVLAYLQLLEAYKNAGCNPMCPPDPCPMAPKVDCMVTMGMQGTCVVVP